MQQYRNASPERTQLLEILTHVLYGLDSNDESLVFKCSEKIYEEQPCLVLRCFIDEDGMIGHLNIYHVVQHLLHLAEKEETTFQRNKLAMEYLKVVVPHCASLPSSHNELNLSQQLITLYIDSIKDLQPDQSALQALLQKELHALLQSNSMYLPAAVLEQLPTNSLLYERCVGLRGVFSLDRVREDALPRRSAPSASLHVGRLRGCIRILQRALQHDSRGRQACVCHHAAAVWVVDLIYV